MILSIITINKNNAVGLEKTIDSVINQTFSDFEYIIIDGLSEDNSIDIIKKYERRINYWISEHDTGIYNAMNKGINKSNGDYCLFLNSGDYLIKSNTLYELYSEMKLNIFSDLFFSNCLCSDGSLFTYPENITVNYLLDHVINHQNTIIKRSLFKEHGFYNENNEILSDWEFCLKEIWHFKSKFTHVNTNISIFDINGIGSKNSKKRNNEMMTVYQNVFYELKDTILEVNIYHKSTYYNIISNFGNSKALVIILRLYKYMLILLYSIKKIFKNDY